MLIGYSLYAIILLLLVLACLFSTGSRLYKLGILVDFIFSNQLVSHTWLLNSHLLIFILFQSKCMSILIFCSSKLWLELDYLKLSWFKIAHKELISIYIVFTARNFSAMCYLLILSFVGKNGLFQKVFSTTTIWLTLEETHPDGEFCSYYSNRNLMCRLTWLLSLRRLVISSMYYVLLHL